MTAVFLFGRRGNSGVEKPWQARDHLIALQPRKPAYISCRQVLLCDNKLGQFPDKTLYFLSCNHVVIVPKSSRTISAASN